MPATSQIATYARLLRLTPVHDAPIEAVSVQIPAKAEPAKRRRWLASAASLFVFVMLPALVAAAYFWLLAADRYVSEARFVLRKPGISAATTAMASVLPETGITRATDDGYVVQDFLESRDALRWLEQHAGLKAAYEVGRGDPVWGFPNPFSSLTDEGLYKHYQRMISTKYDSTTGLTTLKVQAFAPADAQRLASSLLDAAETLVNRLNERARRDAIGLAEAEADRMRQRVLVAQAALTAFRERERLLDPAQATLAVLETIGKLSYEAAQVSVQINELGKVSPDGPQIAPLRGRRVALEGQIVKERERLAGDAQSIAPRIVEYERLMLEREFGEKALIAAMTTVETARIEALRQQVYLERVAMPGRPDYPAYPWKMIWLLATVASGYMAWRMWRVLVSDTLRHTES